MEKLNKYWSCKELHFENKKNISKILYFELKSIVRKLFFFKNYKIKINFRYRSGSESTICTTRKSLPQTSRSMRSWAKAATLRWPSICGRTPRPSREYRFRCTTKRLTEPDTHPSITSFRSMRIDWVRRIGKRSSSGSIRNDARRLCWTLRPTSICVNLCARTVRSDSELIGFLKFILFYLVL